MRGAGSVYGKCLPLAQNQVCSDFREDAMGTGLVKNWTVRGTVHVFSE